MKNLFSASLAATIFLMSCGNANSSPEVANEKIVATLDESNSPDAIHGKVLVENSDCLGCHKSNGQLIGPSFVDIAKKYPSTAANINQLANKIILGVTVENGIWGKMPMSAHPQLSSEDAGLMVKYILSVKE